MKCERKANGKEKNLLGLKMRHSRRAINDRTKDMRLMASEIDHSGSQFVCNGLMGSHFIPYMFLFSSLHFSGFLLFDCVCVSLCLDVVPSGWLAGCCTHIVCVR